MLVEFFILGSFFRKHKVIGRVFQPYDVECRSRVIKSILNNFNIPYEIRFCFCNHFERVNTIFYFSNSFSFGNICFSCVGTMRTRALLGKIGFCRFGLKFLGEQGMLVGFQRASW